MEESREQLIKELIDIQNEPKFSHVDILTITGFMNDKQLANHVSNYRKRLKESEK